MRRITYLTLAACLSAVSAGAADVGFVAEAGPGAVKRQTIDGSAIVITRGRAGAVTAHRVVTPALPAGAYFARAGAASSRDAARAACRGLTPAGAWDLPDAGASFLGMITIGAEFGPEHVSTVVVLEEAKPGLPHTLRNAYLVWLRGGDARDEARLAGTDKLYVFTDGNGGADDRFISLAESRSQLTFLLGEAAKLPAERRDEAVRAAKRLYDAVKGDVAVYCVSGLAP